MRLHSDLFHLCLLVAYSVANIYMIDKHPISRYKIIIKQFDDIINQASNLLDKYYMLKREDISNYVATDHGNSVFVNEIKKSLNDATRYDEDRKYDTDQERSDILIEPLENLITNELTRETDYNKKVEQFNVYPSRSYTNSKSFNRELKAIDSSKDVIAFVKILLQTNSTSNNMKRTEKLDRPMKTVVKKYYPASMWVIILKNRLNKLRSNVVIDTNNLVVKYVKDGASIFDDLKKVEYIQEGDSANNKGRYNSEEVNSRTLRDGCIHCAKALLRKCFKALKRSTKDTCRIYHCKSGFKSTFKSYSKTACLHEFTDDHKDDNRTLLYSSGCKTKSRYSRRGGYVDLCKGSVTLRELDLEVGRFHESSLKDNAIMNILRDKYDRACEKELYKKCSRACKCTIETTCNEHRCMKKKVKRLTKDCKAQCKTAFIKAESSESEESTDSSDENTHEDSE